MQRARRARRPRMAAAATAEAIDSPRPSFGRLRSGKTISVQAIVEKRSGCCGAIRHHLNDHDGGLSDARRNIDERSAASSAPVTTRPALMSTPPASSTGPVITFAQWCMP